MSMPDQSSRQPDSDKEFPEWDGKPKIGLTWGQAHSLYSYVPQWHGEAVGPVLPFTGGNRARVRVDSIFRPTREGALTALEGHCRSACAEEGLAYFEDQWEVTHLVLINAC